MRQTFILLALLLTANSLTPNSLSYTPAQQETPSYAKWSQLAIKETKSRYLNADIIDYLHVGRESIGNTTTEKFKLWLKDDKHEFGVIVTIKFDTKTEKIIKMEFHETTN